jgi:precorrin-2 dehydrogenase/sirohydrochlorin ferrochelatase
MDGDMEAARRLLEDALADAGAAVAGRITVIGGQGPADLLSLRAVRALGQADVIIAEDGCSPDIIAFARRDARRASAIEATPARLIEMTSEGLQVAWLTTAPVSADCLRMLADAKTPIEVLTATPPG